MPESHPTAFISYSWTSDAYAERVVRFVEDLRAAGIEVVFDRYDLQAGQDKHTFMERAVTDPSVDFVLILCDPLYAEKADGRRGGVGTETLIISAQVYNNANQERFIPVIMQREGDRIQVPTYLEGRIFYDLTGPDEIVQFERLVAKLHGRADLTRTPLGPRPSYVDEPRTELRTGRRLDVFRNALDRGQPHAIVRLEDYLDRLEQVLCEEAIPDSDISPPPDEWAVAVIERLRPYRDEFVELCRVMARYDESGRFAETLHDFFERLLTKRLSYAGREYSPDVETTPIAFQTWEMFLCATASLLQKERFGHLTALFEPYRVSSEQRGPGILRSFTIIDPGFQLLDSTRVSRLRVMGRVTPSAELIRKRATDGTPSVDNLIEADVFCWLRSAVTREPTDWTDHGWYPRLLQLGAHTESLPLFVRAGRRSVFAKLAPALGVPDRDTLVARLDAIPDARLEGIDGFWGGRARWYRLLQIESLDTK